jgi:hypothetical protein
MPLTLEVQFSRVRAVADSTIHLIFSFHLILGGAAFLQAGQVTLDHLT